MEKLYFVLGGWFALNAVVATMLLTRRSRPHVRQRLFRWVMSDRPPARPRRWAHNLIVAHRHHH
jgi:hypothetical protein